MVRPTAPPTAERSRLRRLRPRRSGWLDAGRNRPPPPHRPDQRPRARRRRRARAVTAEPEGSLDQLEQRLAIDVAPDVAARVETAATEFVDRLIAAPVGTPAF